MGKPNIGTIFHFKRSTKLKYKFAIRQVFANYELHNKKLQADRENT